MEYENPINFPKLSTRIIDTGNSETYDQLYFIGTRNNYVKKSGIGNISAVSSMGNFWVNQESVTSKIRDILDGGNSDSGVSQFEGPIIGGEFPTDRELLNQ